MGEYRRAVQDAVQLKAQMACVLSEDWTGGYDVTVQKCEDRVRGCTYFVLLLGHYYGWVPAGDKSITHLEYEWAFTRWQSEPRPPMAVFAPRQGCDADRELLTNAERELAALGAHERATHEGKLAAFRAQVLGAGRTATFYSTLQDLREHAIVACYMWKGSLLAAALTPTLRRAVSDDELGSLGRRKHAGAVETGLAIFQAEPDEPAIAFLVHGNEDAGQRLFLRHLARSDMLAGGRPPELGRPPMATYDLLLLIRWVAKALGIPRSTELDTPRQLADALAGELHRQSLCVMLDRVDGLRGGLARFASDFWRPLRGRLRELHDLAPLPHRLTLFVADHSEDLGEAQRHIADVNDDPQDYGQLVALPRLGNFQRRDITEWLQQLKVPERPAGRRKEIAASVLKSSAGIEEGRPLRIYEQLRSINLFEDSE